VRGSAQVPSALASEPEQIIPTDDAPPGVQQSSLERARSRIFNWLHRNTTATLTFPLPKVQKSDGT